MERCNRKPEITWVYYYTIIVIYLKERKKEMKYQRIKKYIKIRLH